MRMSRAVVGAGCSSAAALLLLTAVALRSRSEPPRSPSDDPALAREVDASAVPTHAVPGPDQEDARLVQTSAADRPRRGVGPPRTGPLRISGFVRSSPLEPDANEPVPGATVYLLPAGTAIHWPAVKAAFPNLYPSARTDGRGAFTLAAEVPPSILPITAEFVAEVPGTAFLPGSPPTVRIESVPFERSDLVVFLSRTPTLGGEATDAARSTVLEGEVTDAATGGRVVGARVEWNPPDRGSATPPLAPNSGAAPGRGTATTGRDGRFLLVLEPAKKGTLLVAADGYHAARLQVDGTSASHALTIPLLRLDDLPVIHGVVLGPSGTPGSSALVNLEPLRLAGPASGERAQGARALALRDFEERIRGRGERCGIDGSFRVAVPCGGLWKVTVRLEGLVKEAELRVEPNGTTSCRVVLDPPCRLRVRVVDEGGAPVTANVCFHRGSAIVGSTAQEGVLDLGGFVSGEEIRVYAELHGSRSPEVTASFRTPGEVVDLGTLAIRSR
ncbi:MAG TPA: hypothetical protein VFI25_07790 [Planctomycetota bacterium]|jgi:hypothetical protein|nr:hypothetical protein [Planctomycetota bacterium]